VLATILQRNPEVKFEGCVDLDEVGQTGDDGSKINNELINVPNWKGDLKKVS